MKKFFIAALLFLAAAIGVGCGNALSEKDKAIDFTLTSISGNAVKLSDYKGKIIILNFFATWCPPCRMEMPDFNEIASEYKNEVEIIAVNVGGEDVSGVEKFAKSLSLSFNILMDDGKVSSSYGPIRAIPVTYIIDKNFNIAKQYIGARTKEAFVGDIEELR